MKRFVVSLHDVAPSTAELSRRWVNLLEEHGVRASLLVVPGNWNCADLDSSPSFVEWLKEAEAKGHEIVQHGFTHTRNKSYTTTKKREWIGALLARGCEEFWHLPLEESLHSLIEGRTILGRHGFQPEGFVAPGWLMSPGTITALSQAGFAYTNTHTRIIDLSDLSSRRSIALSQRPRSILSLPAVALTKTVLAVLVKFSQPVRIAIHPRDIINARLREANLRMCDELKDAGYVSMTYGEIYRQVFNHKIGIQNTGV